jgi:hypothetical protein
LHANTLRQDLHFEVRKNMPNRRQRLARLAQANTPTAGSLPGIFFGTKFGQAPEPAPDAGRRASHEQDLTAMDGEKKALLALR